MTDPADLAKALESLQLDPEVAKVIGKLKEQNNTLKASNRSLETRDAVLKAENTELKAEVIHMREKEEMHTKMQQRQREKIQGLEAKLKAQEAELDPAISAVEEYKLEVERLERYIDVDLLEINEENVKKIKDLTKSNKELRARIMDNEADSDIKMCGDIENARPICPIWTAGGGCRNGIECRHGQHPIKAVAATETQKRVKREKDRDF